MAKRVKPTVNQYDDYGDDYGDYGDEYYQEDDVQQAIQESKKQKKKDEKAKKCKSLLLDYIVFTNPFFDNRKGRHT